MTTSHRVRDAHTPNPRLRVLVLMSALVVLISAIIWNGAFRDIEAHAAALLASPFTHSVSHGDGFAVGLGTNRALALTITPECTSALLALPGLLAFCFFISFRNVRLHLAVLGLAAALLVVFVTNQARLGLIVLGWAAWGDQGLWLAHTIVGSVLSVIAMLVALLVQLRITARNSRADVRHY